MLKSIGLDSGKYFIGIASLLLSLLFKQFLIKDAVCSFDIFMGLIIGAAFECMLIVSMLIFYSFLENVFDAFIRKIIKYQIVKRFPISKEELEKCGVHNRIECFLYYKYILRGFNNFNKWISLDLEYLGSENENLFEKIFKEYDVPKEYKIYFNQKEHELEHSRLIEQIIEYKIYNPRTKLDQMLSETDTETEEYLVKLLNEIGEREI